VTTEELHRALTKITEIREHMARTEVFRGYRAVPVALSGFVALAVGALQPSWIPDPLAAFDTWLLLWAGAAALSLIVFGVEITWRYRRTESHLERERIRIAVARFLPAVVAGGLLTLAIARHAEESRWLLPGLWSILMALAVFASRDMLPRAVVAVGVFYMAAGLAVIVLARGESALSPFAMAIPFGVGQFLAAGVLYFTLERKHDG
jgi:hypothetical protein